MVKKSFDFYLIFTQIFTKKLQIKSFLNDEKSEIHFYFCIINIGNQALWTFNETNLNKNLTKNL